MKAFEVTGTLDEKGQLLLDRPLTLDTPGPVRIIVLLPEPTDEAEDDPDDTPVEEVKASLRKGLLQGKAGQTRLISEQWERIDAEKGQLLLDRPLTPGISALLRIILLSEPIYEAEEDPDDTTVAEVKASLKRAFQEAKTRQRIPLSQMWEGIDVECIGSSSSNRFNA